MAKKKQNELLHEQGQFGNGSGNVPTPSGESFLAPKPRRPIDKYVCPHKLDKIHLIPKYK